ELPDDEEAFQRLQTIYRERGDLEPLARLLAERLEAQPHSSDARRWRRERIDALEKLGRGEEAGEEWWRAAQADPTDMEAYARLTAFHTARRNWKVVVRVLDDWLAAASSASDKAELYVRLAEVHRHQFDDEKTAVAAYEKALARVPEHAGAQSALLEIYREHDDLAKMLPLLESRLRWATDPRERTQTLAELWEVGSRLGAEGDVRAGRRALEALKEACLLAPGDEKLWQALEGVLSGRETVADLAGHLEARAARQEGAERAASLLKAAEAWRRATRHDDERGQDRVRRCLERARDAAPVDHPVIREILFLLREIYTDSNAWEALAAILAQLADERVCPEPIHRRPLLEELAWLLAERLGRPLEAVGHMQALLELSERDSERDAILGRLVTLHGGLGDWHRVIALTEERISLHRGTEREADLHLAAAEIAERRISNYEAALGHLRAALAVRPGDENTLDRVERVCAAAGRHGDHAAIIAEEGRRAKDPVKKAGLLIRSAAIKEEKLGDPAGARRDLEAALDTESLPSETMEAATSSLARVLSTLRAYDDLANLYDRLVEEEARPEVRADLLVALGLIHEEQRSAPDQAMEAYRKALEVDPENTAALDAVARLAEQEGDLSAALGLRLRQAEVAWLPSMRAELLCKAAAIHEQRGENVEALDCYERACSIDGSSSRALRGRLRLLRELGRGEEALETSRSLAEVAEEPEEIASLWAAVGEGLEAEGKRAEAKAAFEKALAAVPDHGQACASLARLELLEGKPSKALSLLDLAAERLERENDVEGLADVHRQAAAACESLGRPEDAKRKLHDAYRLGPTRRDTLDALALHFSSRQDPVRTYEILSTLLEHHGSSLSRTETVSVLRRQGLALAAMGRGGDAARKLHEALSIAPKDRDVIVALAGIYEESGRWAEVVELKRKLLDLARGKRNRRRLSLEIADLFADRLHDAASAARVLSSALEAHPDDPEILARLAEEQEKRGAYDEAADCLERIVGTAADGGRTRLWVRLGRLRHERLGAPLRAMLAYRRAVEVATDGEELEHALTA
ncbi:MAG: tetratricopeptide repeat protein, partial [Myxococcota bacterium]